MGAHDPSRTLARHRDALMDRLEPAGDRAPDIGFVERVTPPLPA